MAERDVGDGLANRVLVEAPLGVELLLEHEDEVLGLNGQLPPLPDGRRPVRGRDVEDGRLVLARERVHDRALVLRDDGRPPHGPLPRRLGARDTPEGLPGRLGLGRPDPCVRVVARARASGGALLVALHPRDAVSVEPVAGRPLVPAKRVEVLEDSEMLSLVERPGGPSLEGLGRQDVRQRWGVLGRDLRLALPLEPVALAARLLDALRQSRQGHRQREGRCLHALARRRPHLVAQPRSRAPAGRAPDLDEAVLEVVAQVGAELGSGVELAELPDRLGPAVELPARPARARLGVPSQEPDRVPVLELPGPRCCPRCPVDRRWRRRLFPLHRR